MPTPARILVTYHTRRGHTLELARVVASGAEAAGGDVLFASVEQVTADHLLRCDGLIVGSPVHTGAMSAPIKQFFDDWQFRFNFYPDRPMRNKVGAAFATGGQMASGRETTVLGMLIAMLHHRMVVVGGEVGIGASAATEAKPVALDDDERSLAGALGARVVEVARMLRAGAALV